MDIKEEILKQKSREILLNLKYGKDSKDNIIKYSIDYLDGSNLSFIDSFNSDFNPDLFMKRFLYDIKFNDQIESIKLFITNKYYADYRKNNHYYYIDENLKLDDNFMNNIERIESIIKLYHLYSSSEFLKYNSFTDQNYKLVNSIVDLVNENETFNYGYILNYKRMPKTENVKYKNKVFIFHQLCTLYSIKNDSQTVQIDDNVYKGINFDNNSSIDYTIDSMSSDLYLKDYSFFKNNNKLLLSFPYLVEYIMDLINWKYVNQTSIIPDEVYDELKNKYINSKKVKEHVK